MRVVRTGAAPNLTGFVGQLNDLLAVLPEPLGPGERSKRSVSELRADIQKAVERLSAFARALDPVKHPDIVLDPSEPSIVGQLIARTLLSQSPHPLNAIAPFYGSGVYALYYRGEFEAYRRIRGRPWPLYVGKADPAEPQARDVEEQGTTLARRLSDHARSIGAVRNLSLSDFSCQYLVVKSAWQGTAEQYLIDWFRPVWNSEVGICFGFGKHGDSASTRANTRSPWDTLHPGRSWAWKEGNVANPKTAAEIEAAVVAHLKETFRGRRKVARRIV